MNIVFRVDSSIQIGTGHVMRCLTLAEVLKSRSVHILFICKDLPGSLHAYIRQNGFEVFLLPALVRQGSSHDRDRILPEQPDPDWERDAAATRTAITATGRACDWLIVDNYALDLKWEQSLRSCAGRIMVIDDLANREHDCDLLLDQNLNLDLSARYEHLLPAGCRRLFGSRYVLLRPEFSAARSDLRPRDGAVRRIMVFFGGIDPGNETLKTLNAIRKLDRHDISVDVVVGTTNPNIDSLRTVCKTIPQVTLYERVENIAELMARADLAIGASGGTSWERCCVGLPALIVTVAMNQETTARMLEAKGCVVYLGMDRQVTAGMIAQELQTLLSDPHRIKKLSEACAGIIDGKGTHRVALALDTEAIILRKAQAHDRDPTLEWRNAEQTRKFSHHPELISREDHERWFTRVLGDTNCELLIGECNDKPVGVLRYDCDGPQCTVSIYLVPGQYGRGYGARLLLAGHEWLREHHARVRTIRAEILSQNQPSMEVFQQAGYKLESGFFLKQLQ